MKALYDDLWISTPEFIEETPDQQRMMHGFMLRHPRGNLVISRLGHPQDLEALAELGGVMRHYLTHWHEASPIGLTLQQRFNSALYCHTRALGPVSRVLEPDATFNFAEQHFGDFDVLPSPGHTPGSTSFLYRSPYGKTYLFVGATLTRAHGRWATVRSEESNQADLAQTLSHYRTLRPDVVLMSHTWGHLSWQEVTLEQWLAAIDDAEQFTLDERESSHAHRPQTPA
ncbi:hypothetical protein PMPD1_1876 [Paramixta manurensis]|uniref:MBL fold metallo-hydrolase n=1 Tax=Paramixta manurensis TaxID=2740817 RepID=A0A6M8U7U3_9GAMM|nr:hypothetical protein PMPD1_1876 [Erwiniaceae bacterium PD-1]